MGLTDFSTTIFTANLVLLWFLMKTYFANISEDSNKMKIEITKNKISSKKNFLKFFSEIFFFLESSEAYAKKMFIKIGAIKIVCSDFDENIFA